MARAKVRIRFRKNGDLRLIGHHDLMRCFERMLRRAALPFHSTEGFNPKPRLVFALPLPLGIIGCDEVADLELDASVAPEEIRERLARQAPAGLEILAADSIDHRTKAHARLACYRVSVPSDRSAAVPERVSALLTRPECWIERRRPQWRKLNVRPYIQAVRMLPGTLEMDLVVTPGGTVRPEEILGLLGLEDLLEEGAVLQRTRLELEEEPVPLPLLGRVPQ